MNDSRTRTRKASSRRSRKVQKTFTTLLADEDSEQPPQAFANVDLKAFPYRVALANWPDVWRERWGRRANALEESGLDWQDAEARAFFEIQDERRMEVGIQPIPLAKPTTPE